MPTVREVLKARIDRLQERKARLVLEAQTLQIEIDALQAERVSLTASHDDLFQRLQALGVMKAED